MKNNVLMNLAAASLLLLSTGMVTAAENGHQGHDMSKHKGHDTGAAAHIHHGHGKGSWMFEYKYMSMKMEGLLKGSDSIATTDVAGTIMDMMGTSTNKGCNPMNAAMKHADGKTCMAPTEMTMNMHMIMGMYGLNDKVTLMGMLHYMQNDMDMIMYMPTGMSMTGSMETSGLSDAVLGGMYVIDDKLTTTLGVSIPTGATDEMVTMKMGTMPARVMRAPYGMQLGSGTYDLMPSVTYNTNAGKWAYGAQGTYTLRTGENDEGYTLGNKLEITGYGKYAVSNGMLLTGRLSYLDWDKIEGSDSQIASHMNTTNNPENYGGTRIDLYLGINALFDKKHMLGLEYGVPVQQDLNGIQLETDSIISVAYQYMM